MPIPNLQFVLLCPGGTLDITALVSQESGAEITARIEAPGGANQFTAPDVSIKIRDSATKAVYNLLRTITPGSTSYRLQVLLAGQMLFTGPILPVSVQFDEIENSVAITATGYSILLASSNPATYFQRPWGGNWRTAQLSGDPGSIIIQGYPPQPLGSAFQPGDTINMTTGGFKATAVIRTIAAYNVDQTLWTIWFEEALSQQVPVGAWVTLDPESNWKRNILFNDAVQWCYQAAGLPPPSGSTYNPVLQFGSAGANLYGVSLMATPMNMAGIAGTPLGLSPRFAPGDTYPYPNDRTLCVVGTSTNAYVQAATGPTAAWNRLDYGHPDGAMSQMQDWTQTEKYHNEYYLFGQTYMVVPTVSFGQRILEVYAYDYVGGPAGTYYRYVLRYEGQFDPETMTTDFSVIVYQEEATDGYSWRNRTQLNTTGMLTTSTLNMNEMAYDDPNWAYYAGYEVVERRKGGVKITPVGSPIQGKGTWGMGIVISNDGSKRNLLLTRPRLSGASGSPAEWVLCVMRISDGTILATTGAGLRGWLGRPRGAQSPGQRMYLASLDSFENASPSMLTGWWDGGTALYPMSNSPVPYDIRPWTICVNENATTSYGETFVFCLASSFENGVRLLQAYEYNLAFAPDIGSSVLGPPGATNEWVDLCVVKDLTRRAGVNGEFFPMVGIWAGSLWWVDYLATGGLPIGDVSGMSSGDVLAQLCTLVNAAYWATGNGTNYLKTRGLAASDWIGGTEALSNVQDAGLLTLRAGPVWSKTYMRVAISNEKNEAIKAAYPPVTDQWIGSDQELTISNRFIFSYSFAYALAKKIYEYFSSPIQTLEIEHEDDSRQWEVGFHFAATVMGTYSRWQIIEVTRQAFASVLRIQAVRVG